MARFLYVVGHTATNIPSPGPHHRLHAPKFCASIMHSIPRCFAITAPCCSYAKETSLALGSSRHHPPAGLTRNKRALLSTIGEHTTPPTCKRYNNSRGLNDHQSGVNRSRCSHLGGEGGLEHHETKLQATEYV